MITVYCYQWVPPFAQGLVRDLPVRWALEEAGVAYAERVIAADQDAERAALKAVQPFGQVPAIEVSGEEGGLVLFECAAIVHWLAGKYPQALAPSDEGARAQMTAWLFAAVNSLDARLTVYNEAKRAAEASGHQERLEILRPQTAQRLADLAAALGDKEYLLGDFTAADIVMVHILRASGDAAMIEEVPALAAYVKRAMARPAFQKALADQLRHFQAEAA